MTRSLQQNNLYHSYATQLYNSKEVSVWDGRYTEYGYPNPFRFRPSGFSYNTFRDLLKMLDFEFDRDELGKPLSSSKVNVETMNKHINFIQCLLDER